jgi:soluble lytic murein transglycosylase
MKRILRLFFITLLLFVGGVVGWEIKSTKTDYVYVYVDSVLDVNKIRIDDPRLISAIIRVESNNNPRAVSSKEAYGLMQVRYSVWKDKLREEVGIRSRWELFNPDKNVMAGKYILQQHHKWSKGDLRKTLQDYSGNAAFYYEKVMYYYMTGR